MNQNHHKRVFFSFRQLHFRRKIKSTSQKIPLSFLQNSNPNSRLFSSFLRSIYSLSRNSSPLIPNSRIFSSFNGVRTFATRLSEPNNRPPKETIFLEGCDFEHWLVVVDNPESQLTRDEIIDGYVKTLAHVVGSEDEARMKIYSVSTRHYFAFGALLSEEVAYKLKELPHVQWVLPDSYLDVKNKTYAGEPFINGQAVPYDPKYHEIWVRNHEQSLKNNMKNKRKQRDPTTSRFRQRSPASASPNISNGNLIPATSPQNQASHGLTMQDHSLSDVPNSNIVLSPQQAESPGQMLKPTPPIIQSHDSHLSQISNNSISSTQPPSQSNYPSNGHQNKNWTHVSGSQNQAWQPSQMHKQTPFYVASHTHTPVWSGHNPGPALASGYLNLSREPSVSNNDYHLYNNLPPSSSGSNVPSHMRNSNVQQGSMPPEVEQNDHDRMVPHHRQNSVSQDGCPSELPKYPPYQDSYTDMQSSNATILNPHGNSIHQTPNMTPSARAQGMPPYMQSTGFYTQDTSSAPQLNGHSYRSFPVNVQNGNTHYNSPSTAPQHQQNQNSSMDFPSSNKMSHSQGAMNYENANTTPSMHSRDMPAQMLKQNSFRENSHSLVQLNGTTHSGCYPSQSYSLQQYQNSSGNIQSSNDMVSPSNWNDQNTTTPLQNNGFPNANMMHGVLNQCHGADMPSPLKTNECQYDMRGDAKQNDCSEGAQTRDYQERDIPSDDDYVYASK